MQVDRAGNSASPSAQGEGVAACRQVVPLTESGSLMALSAARGVSDPRAALWVLPGPQPACT